MWRIVNDIKENTKKSNIQIDGHPKDVANKFMIT